MVPRHRRTYTGAQARASHVSPLAHCIWPIGPYVFDMVRKLLWSDSVPVGPLLRQGCERGFLSFVPLPAATSILRTSSSMPEPPRYHTAIGYRTGPHTRTGRATLHGRPRPRTAAVSRYNRIPHRSRDWSRSHTPSIPLLLKQTLLLLALLIPPDVRLLLKQVLLLHAWLIRSSVCLIQLALPLLALQILPSIPQLLQRALLPLALQILPSIRLLFKQALFLLALELDPRPSSSGRKSPTSLSSSPSRSIS